MVAATAHASDEHRAESVRAGFDGFLTKPITPEKLAGVLEPLLRPLRPAISGHGPGAESASPFNLRLLEELSGDSKKGTVGQIARFIAELETEIAKLRVTLASEDIVEIQHAAHRVVGLGRMIDSFELTAIAERIYFMAATGNGAEFRDALEEINAAVDTLKVKLEEHAGASEFR
jgi:CheY-like chemotaxis protein